MSVISRRRVCQLHPNKILVDAVRLKDVAKADAVSRLYQFST